MLKGVNLTGSPRRYRECAADGHFGIMQLWEAAAQQSQREDGCSRVLSHLSPYRLTSLLIQHDQSPDAGIFTLADRQEETKTEEEEKTNRGINVRDQ